MHEPILTKLTITVMSLTDISEELIQFITYENYVRNKFFNLYFKNIRLTLLLLAYELRLILKFRFVFWDEFIALVMEAARTSETSVDNYFTLQHIPEDKSKLHTRRHENLKSHDFSKVLTASIIRADRQ
jgi:hypothetical protein